MNLAKKVDLKTEDGLLDELEKIVNEVEAGMMAEKHAKIRLFAAKEAVRIMALKLIRERFQLQGSTARPNEITA